VHPVYVRRRLRRKRAALHAAKRFPIWLAGLILVGLLGAMGVGAAFGVYLTLYDRYTEDFVDPATLIRQNYEGPTRLYDRNGTLLFELLDPHATLKDPVPLQQISPLLREATVAVEDASFYDNPGINVRGLARAAYENFIDRDDGVLQGTGGSSITQQLVRNVYIPFEERGERSIDRKLKEAFIAIELTKRFSKDQILEWYLNEISYGGIYNGAEAAANGYFGKPASQLSLAEAALLAGVPASPEEFFPIDETDGTLKVNPLAKSRQQFVLNRMVEEGYITREDANRASQEPIVFVRQEFPIKAGHFVNYVRDRLLEMCEAGMIERKADQTCNDLIFRGGLEVQTTLDLNLQARAEGILKQAFLDRYGGVTMEQACQCHNGSIVSIEPSTGEILVYVGSRDFFDQTIDGEVDNIDAVNQPGSSFKPVVYLASFIHLRRHPMSIVFDDPIEYKQDDGTTFVPRNPDGRFRGPMQTRVALGSSQNIPANRTAEDVGVTRVLDTAHRLGVTTMVNEDFNYGPSIATGGSNIKSLDMAYVNATFSNMGVMVGVRTAQLDRDPVVRKIDPVVVREIRDPNGQLVYQHEQVTEQVVDARQVWLVHSIMSDCSARLLIWGCNSVLDIPGQSTGVKTGTQQGALEAQTLETWTNGYSRHIATSVWIGNSDNTLVSSSLASPIIAQNVYHAWMEAFHEGKERIDFQPPEGVRQASVPTVPASGGGGALPSSNTQQNPSATPTPGSQQGSGGSCSSANGWIIPGETYVESCAQAYARRKSRGIQDSPESGSSTIPTAGPSETETPSATGTVAPTEQPTEPPPPPPPTPTQPPPPPTEPPPTPEPTNVIAPDWAQSFCQDGYTAWFEPDGDIICLPD
jgi:membrane peptidoglycan carboxypeptidase